MTGRTLDIAFWDYDRTKLLADGTVGIEGVAPSSHSAHILTFNNMTVMLPWLTKLISDDRALLGDDWWPYGIGANRAAIDAVLRYHHEQGLTRRRFAIEEVFVPSLLNT